MQMNLRWRMKSFPISLNKQAQMILSTGYQTCFYMQCRANTIFLRSNCIGRSPQVQMTSHSTALSVQQSSASTQGQKA
jgi:hypothetical protein